MRHLFRKTNIVSKYRSTRYSGVASGTSESNLQMLHDLGFEYPKNLFYGYKSNDTWCSFRLSCNWRKYSGSQNI